jgi:hypothetical protein
MAQTSILSSISRTGTFPIRKTINAPNNCGTISLVLNQNWTEQMIHELPTINVAVYIDTDIKLLSIDIDMSTVTSDNIELRPITPYSIPLFDLPTDFDFVVTPIFDEDALLSHNLQIDSGDIDVFNTSDNGIVDTNISSYINEYWTTKTDTFNLNMVFDNSNIASGGSGGGGGGGQITVDTQVMQGSTNPVQNGAIYDFVNSSVSTNTAYFIGTFNSLSDLENYSGEVSNNDYAFVVSVDSNSNTVYNRYKYNSENETWNFEYSLNNSSFTAAEWETIQSGLTANDRTNYNNHLTNTNNPHSVTKAQVGLGNVDNTSDANKPVSTAMQAALNEKQDTLTFDGTYNASTNKAATVSTVTNAINSLDVSSVGGSGKYISAISETNGKISATATTMDTTPTANSQNPVTSGGVAASQAEQDAEIAVIANAGAKNIAPVNSGSGTSVNLFNRSCFVPAGKYILSYKASDFSGRYELAFYDATDTYISGSLNGSITATKSVEFILQADAYRMRFSILGTATISELMLRPAAITDPTYVPYALPNPTLTPAAIKAVDDGAKNLLQLFQLGSSNANVGNPCTSQGVEYEIQSDGTITAYRKSSASAGAYIFLYKNGSIQNVSEFFDGNHIWSGNPPQYPDGGVSVWYKIGSGSNTTMPNGGLLPNANGEAVQIGFQIQTALSPTQSNPIVFKPMICTASDWAVSQKFVPYALTNPVITPALIEQVDNGAKNVAQTNNITQTGNGFFNTDPISGDLFVSAATVSTTASSSTFAIVFYYTDGTISPTRQLPITNSLVHEFDTGEKVVERVRIFAGDTTESSSGKTITLTNFMICTASDYAVSPKFVPYRPSWQELTTKEQQNENNILWNTQNGVKNIYKITNVPAVSGVTITKTDANTVSLNGTFSGDIYVFFTLSADNVILPAGDWVVFTKATGAIPARTLTISNNVTSVTLGSYATFSTSESKKIGVYVQFLKNDSVNGSITIMICPKPLYDADPTYQPYAMSNLELTNSVGRLGYTIETVTLSNVTISKASAGIFYTPAIDVSDKFDLLLGATLNNFGNLQSNIAIMPAVKPTNKTYSLWICDSTNPATLPVVANTQIQVVLYGITK